VSLNDLILLKLYVGPASVLIDLSIPKTKEKSLEIQKTMTEMMSNHIDEEDLKNLLSH
jgi:hypothetical protein